MSNVGFDDKARAYVQAMQAMRCYLEGCHVVVAQHNERGIIDHGRGFVCRLE